MSHRAHCHRAARWAAATWTLLLLAACGRGGGTSTPVVDTPPPAAGLEVPSVEPQVLEANGNNPLEAAMGSAGTALREDVPRAYGDGISSPAGRDRASARAVSNAVCAQDEDVVDQLGLSDMSWVWGQFIDHDPDLTPGCRPRRAAAHRGARGRPRASLQGACTGVGSPGARRAPRATCGLACRHEHDPVLEEHLKLVPAAARAGPAPGTRRDRPQLRERAPHAP